MLSWGTSFFSVMAPCSFFTCECEGPQASPDLNLLFHWTVSGFRTVDGIGSGWFFLQPRVLASKSERPISKQSSELIECACATAAVVIGSPSWLAGWLVGWLIGHWLSSNLDAVLDNSFFSVTAPCSFFTCECEGPQASLDLNLLFHWTVSGFRTVDSIGSGWLFLQPRVLASKAERPMSKQPRFQSNRAN